MAARTQHLLQRAGRYYARVVVPDALRKIIGKRELTEPLAADLRDAKDALPGVVARMKATIQQARYQTIPASHMPRRGRHLTDAQIARAHYAAELALDDKTRNAGAELSLWARNGQLDALKRVASGAADNDEIAATIGWAVDTMTGRGNATAETGSPAWRTLARTLAMVQIEAAKRMTERDAGDFTGKPSLPVLTEPDPAKPKNGDPLADRFLTDDSALTLRDLLPRFLAESEMSEASKNEHDVSVRMFDEFTGEPRPLFRITRRDVLAYKDALLATPANYVKRFPNLSLPEAIKANKERKAPFPTLQNVTVDSKWLSNLRSLLNWCVDNDLIPDNPAHGVKSATRKKGRGKNGKRVREPFNSSDLTALFSTPLFDRKKPWGEEQWCYLMSLFCGTRASELAQVQLTSIRKEHGFLLMSIDEETKNEGSQRIIPIHKTLLKLGFEKRVAELRKAGETHLFPKWYKGGQEALARALEKAKITGKPITLNHHYPKFLPKRFNDSYRQSVGIHDPRKVFHCWRSTFKSALLACGVPIQVSDALTGHYDDAAPARGYEHVTPAMRKKGIDKLTFDGFPL